MGFVLGIDGGATNTRCACVSLAGEVLAVARAGPSNYLRIGLDAALDNLWAAVSRAVSEAGVDVPATAAVVCVAGGGRPDDRERLQQGLQALGLSPLLHLGTDAEAALAGAHALGPGIVIMAGTGAMALGCNTQGQRARADGWGPLLGDEGSGYWIGCRVLQAVVRACDGRGPSTELVPAVLEHFGLQQVSQLVSRVSLDDASVTQVAALARVCCSTADSGDPVAGAILDDAASALAKSATAVAVALEAPDLPVAPVGGVFGYSGLRQRFGGHLHHTLPRAPVVEPVLSPVGGAVLMALELAGTRDVLHKLVRHPAL